MITEPYTYSELISRIENTHSWAKPKHLEPSSPPLYNRSLAEKLGYASQGLGLGVYEMKNHMTDEGFQLFLALESNGYLLAGNGFKISYSDYNQILERYLSLRKQLPGICVVQDKREWRPDSNRNNKGACFTHLDKLRDSTSTFRLTIVKDAQHENAFHKCSADEIGCHAWVTYYNDKIVRYLAPYIRPQHIVRTYHSIDASIVPEFKVSERKKLAILSGAMSKHYPLRTRLLTGLKLHRGKVVGGINKVELLTHPGYSNTHCHIHRFLQTLSRYRVSICTSSMYGYCLRKIIESVACGCIVVTDLPVDDKLPIIDDALVRIHPDESIENIQGIINLAISTYCPDKQEFYAKRCQAYYKYEEVGYRLVRDIELMRQNYNV